MSLFMLVAFIVALDQLVKFWAVHVLMSGPSIVLIPGIFQLTYVENRGAAFSFWKTILLFCNCNFGRIARNYLCFL